MYAKILLGFPAALIMIGTAAADPGFIARVSEASNGAEVNPHWSAAQSLSADGQFIVFLSDADNLWPGDSNQTIDIFLHERKSKQTVRIGETAGPYVVENGGDLSATISSDGSTIAFSNTVSGDVNDMFDVFIYERQSGTIELITQAYSGGGVEANGGSYSAKISPEGNFLAFQSDASDLLPPKEDQNGASDIFVYDRQAGVISRVSVNSLGEEANSHSNSASISAQGEFIVFISSASNLGSSPGYPSQVFVHERSSGTTTLVSVNNAGGQPEAGDGVSDRTSISADGRFVAFGSLATNLDMAQSDTNKKSDVFVHDRMTGITTRVSVDSDGREANAGSYHPSISADGRFVAFHSYDRNLDLARPDTNGVPDIFVHDRKTGNTARVSFGIAGQEADGGSFNPVISADGSFVTFASDATNLIEKDQNGTFDVFVAALGPDLTVEAISYSPEVPGIKDRVEFSTTVANVGTKGAKKSTISFQVVSETSPQRFPVPELLPGKRHVIKHEWEAGAAKWYYAAAVADPDNDVPELSEVNNDKKTSFQVVPFGLGKF